MNMSQIEASATRLIRQLAAGVPQTVVVYGTSLTEHGAWSRLLCEWLRESWRGELTWVNSGMSGLNSRVGVEQLESKVIAHSPDTVFIEFGMNDAFQRYDDVAYNLSVAQARSNLEAMIDRILVARAETEIILQTMNPAWDSVAGSGLSATARPELAAYYQMYRDVAVERGLLLIDHEPNWKQLQINDPDLFAVYVEDGTHPVSVAYEALVLPLIQQRLLGVKCEL